MYVYQLTYRDEGNLLPIGYFGSWKKARNVMKKYRSTLPGFKEYPNYFILKKVKLDEDDYYFPESCTRSTRLKATWMMRYILYYKAYYGSIISKDISFVDLMKSEKKKEMQ